MFSLNGKVALITGASGGIGAAIARKMSAAGATVVITGRNEQKLTEVAQSCSVDGNCAPIYSIAIDVGATGAADELIAKTLEQAGKIDILINNAGITRDTLLMRMTDEQFDEVINTNLRSTFLLCRAAAKNRASRIINMASIIGAIGGAGQVNYAASKGGIIALTKSIAAEMGRRLTANTIAPGFIETPMTDDLPAELKDAYLKQIPAGRFGQPDDIANVCVFLASDEAAYINGQTIHVNGGMLRY